MRFASASCVGRYSFILTDISRGDIASSGTREVDCVSEPTG